MMNEGGLIQTLTRLARQAAPRPSACGVQNCSRYICAPHMNSFVEPALRSPSSFHH